MTEYVHIALPKSVAEIIDARARQEYLTRSDVARQYIMRSLIDDTVVTLRRRHYSIRKIAEEINAPTIRVYEALKRTSIDDELYQQDDESEQRELERINAKRKASKS